MDVPAPSKHHICAEKRATSLKQARWTGQVFPDPIGTLFFVFESDLARDLHRTMSFPSFCLTKSAGMLAFGIVSEWRPVDTCSRPHMDLFPFWHLDFWIRGLIVRSAEQIFRSPAPGYHLPCVGGGIIGAVGSPALVDACNATSAFGEGRRRGRCVRTCRSDDLGPHQPGVHGQKGPPMNSFREDKTPWSK